MRPRTRPRHPHQQPYTPSSLAPAESSAFLLLGEVKPPRWDKEYLGPHCRLPAEPSVDEAHASNRSKDHTPTSDPCGANVVQLAPRSCFLKPGGLLEEVACNFASDATASTIGLDPLFDLQRMLPQNPPHRVRPAVIALLNHLHLPVPRPPTVRRLRWYCRGLVVPVPALAWSAHSVAIPSRPMEEGHEPTIGAGCKRQARSSLSVRRLH